MNREREERAAGNGGVREGELERIAKAFLWQPDFNLVQQSCEITTIPSAAAVVMSFFGDSPA